jgi:anaerobic magnesium-protoporphyrin IX monomethyl ester cyclase
MSDDKQLDILLINPNGRLSIYQELGSKLAAIEPPIWTGLMATFVRKKGYSVEIIDSNAFDLAPEEVADIVAERNPVLSAVIVYGHQPSASTQVMSSCGLIVKAIHDKTPDAKTIMVGGHAASLPELTFEEEDTDFVCSGEGPYTLIELIDALKTDKPNLDSVRGICYTNDGVVHRTAPAPLVTDLDEEMPGCAWDLLPMDRYRAHNWECFGGINRQPYAAIYTSLGCPFKCSFCCIQAPFKEGEKIAGYNPNVNTYRMWSTETTLAQIDTLHNDYGVTNFKFADELFVLNHKHVDELCDALIERDYGLNIWAYTRVDTIKDGMPEKLKKAGFNWLALGIEAANSDVRDGVSKGYSQEDILRTVEELREQNIYIIANYIFGLPDDTLETMQETLDMAIELNCEFANFYCTMAYPGSELYRDAIRKSWGLPETWSGYSQHSFDSRPLDTKHLKAAEVLKFRDDAFHTYFENPFYLDMIRNTFDEETVIHIQDMTSHRLKRKLVTA